MRHCGYFTPLSEGISEFAAAYAMAAWCYGWRKINVWTTDRATEIAETARLARRAAELGSDDAVALSRASHALATVVGDVEDALTFVDRALALNPNPRGRVVGERLDKGLLRRTGSGHRAFRARDASQPA